MKKLIYIAFIITSTYSCKAQSVIVPIGSGKFSQRDEGINIDLLKRVLQDIQEEEKISTVYIGEENSNDLILERFKKFTKYEDIERDSIINLVFSKDEFENYKNQTSVDSKWDREIQKNDKIAIELDTAVKKSIINISKPIYTRNKKYALIYRLTKGNRGVYFMPSIDVYFKKNSSWLRVKKIPPRKFRAKTH